jgi:hypothetical protein
VRDLAGNTDNCPQGTFTIGNFTDNTAPTVTSVTPANNATNMGPQTIVTLTFSKSLNPATVTGTSVQLLAGDVSQSLTPQISSDNRTVMLNGSNLSPSTTYTVVATSQVTDLPGNALTYFQSQFTTAPALSATAPRVVTQRPGNGATGVPPTAPITMFTSGSPLDPATVTSSSLRISQNGVLVSGAIAVTGNNQAIQFTPGSNFNFGAVVQIYMDTTVADMNGVPLSAVYNSSFTIAPDPATTGPSPVAANPNPQYNATNVFTNVIPQVAFDQPLLLSTVNGTTVTLLLNNSPATSVVGSVTLLNNNVVQFKPSAALAASSTYYLNLNGVTNTQGRALAQGNGYYMYFTTGTTGNLIAPTITAVGPPDASTGVGENGLAVITFSSPIDPIMVNSSTVTITGGSQTVVPSSISFNTGTNAFTTATITPQAPFPPSTVMTFTINGVTDAQGNAVASQTTHFTTSSGPVLTNPSVVLTSWQNGDTVATNGSFSVGFDRPMDPGTVNDQSLRIYDSNTATFLTETVTLSSNLMTATATPNAPLPSGHTIYVYSGYYGVALDLAGNPQSAFFSTAIIGATSDTTPPVVLETNPPANLVGVPTNAPIEIEFSKEISGTSAGSVQLLQGITPVPVTMSFSRLNTVLTLTPNVPLQANTAYTISILGVRDIVGNTMSGTTTVPFNTGPAVKLNPPNLANNGLVSGSVTPCCSQTGISRTTTIQIAFDSPMDPLTFDTVVKHAALVLVGTQTIVPTTVSFSADFKTVTLTPSAQLAATTSYDVVVNFGFGTVTDMAGNTYNGSFRTSFTTGP